MKKYFCFILIFSFIVLSSFDSFAKSKFYVVGIDGLAIVTVKSKRFSEEFEQAVKIDDDNAIFAALDDFGGETFKLYFGRRGMTIASAGQVMQLKGKKLKKILSLPLTQKEFLSILKYQKPDSFEVVQNSDPAVWQNIKRKKLKVTFSDIKIDKHQNGYPQKILIEYNKYFLDFKWLKVDIKYVEGLI